MPGPDVAAHRPASGREQHTPKITVDLSADEPGSAYEPGPDGVPGPGQDGGRGGDHR